MHSETIHFANGHDARAVFPSAHTELGCAIEALGLSTPRPVVVLIGGAALVDGPHADLIDRSCRVLAEAAEHTGTTVISGGTDVGAMAAMGQAHARGRYSFPLVGITVESQVCWPGRAGSTLAPGEQKRWPLEPHCTHFMLVPGDQFGDESPWIVQAATRLSGTHPSVTILANGGRIARQDVALNIGAGYPVIVLAGTGRLADEWADGAAPPSPLVTVVPARDEGKLYKTVRSMLTS